MQLTNRESSIYEDGLRHGERRVQSALESANRELVRDVAKLRALLELIGETRDLPQVLRKRIDKALHETR